VFVKNVVSPNYNDKNLSINVLLDSARAFACGPIDWRQTFRQTLSTLSVSAVISIDKNHFCVCLVVAFSLYYLVSALQKIADVPQLNHTVIA